MRSMTWIQSCKSRWPAGLGQMHCISGFLYIPACGADQLLQLDHAIKEAENPVWDILAWKCNYKSRKSTGKFVIKNKKRILGRKTARNQPIHQKNTNPWGSTPHKAPQMGPDINKSEWEPQPWLLASGYHGCTCPADSDHGILPRAKAW